MDFITKLNNQLAAHNAKVAFSKNALADFKSLSVHSKSVVLALIVSQAQRGADFKPVGNGKRLESPLHYFAKIKKTSTSLRVVYRPVVDDDGIVEMQLIVIGPRDREEVYKMAEKRLQSFFAEFDKKEN